MGDPGDTQFRHHAGCVAPLIEAELASSAGAQCPSTQFGHPEPDVGDVLPECMCTPLSVFEGDAARAHSLANMQVVCADGVTHLVTDIDESYVRHCEVHELYLIPFALPLAARQLIRTNMERISFGVVVDVTASNSSPAS